MKYCPIALLFMCSLFCGLKSLKAQTKSQGASQGTPQSSSSGVPQSPSLGSTDNLAQAKSLPGESHLIVVQDAGLDEVLAKRIEYNKKAALSPQGFRILVYSGNQRQEAYNAQNRFRQAHPDMEAYLSYQFPNFKVLAGDFHSRDEASKTVSDLKTIFPDEALLLVPQKIDINKLKQ